MNRGAAADRAGCRSAGNRQRTYQQHEYTFIQDISCGAAIDHACRIRAAYLPDAPVFSRHARQWHTAYYCSDRYAERQQNQQPAIASHYVRKSAADLGRIKYWSLNRTRRADGTNRGPHHACILWERPISNRRDATHSDPCRRRCRHLRRIQYTARGHHVRNRRVKQETRIQGK